MLVTRRDTLFVDYFYPGSGIQRAYDVDRRSGRIIMLNRGDQSRERIVVVTGWLDELKERLAGAARK